MDDNLNFSANALVVLKKRYLSKNEKTHITIAFKNTPADSNNIIFWEDILNYNIEPFSIIGTIREVI